MRDRPLVVQHVFGTPGSGGPATALSRIMSSDLADKYEFKVMAQPQAAGGLNVRLLRSFVSALREIRPDLVHVRGLGNEGFHGALAAKIAGCPRILVSIHGTVRDLVNHVGGPRHRVVRDVCEPLTLRLATDVITVCDYAAQRSFLDRARRAGKVRGVVPNGVDVGRRPTTTAAATRAGLGIPPEDVVIISVGRLALDKGFHLLGAALDSAGPQQRRCQLLVVGDGPDREEIAELLAARPWLRVRFLGHREDVPDLLEASDIFVLPSLHENLSNALLEAMAAGIPVVATAVGGTVEVLNHGGGELIRLGDSNAFADALSTLIGDDTYRSVIGKQARDVAGRHYSLGVMTRRLDETYSAILRDGRTR